MGGGELNEGGQNIQTSSYISSRDVMYSMVNIISTAVCYI